MTSQNRESAAPIVLETIGLSKRFSGFTAVENVNLRVEQGSIHALIGPNGAGKTTCFNLITRFQQPSAGQILFDGKDITRTPAPKVSKMGLCRSFQISAVFPHLTALENVRLAVQRNTNLSFRFWNSGRTLENLRATAMEFLATVDLESDAETQAAELSYGRKRALEFATTLALNPRVMLLDEPMAGMGGEDIHKTTELIRRIAATRTVLMVEHNLKVVSELSTRITVLQRGSVLAEGTYAEISNDPRVRLAYMGADDD